MPKSPTDPERQRAIDDLFDGALDQPPDQRAAWLHAQSADTELRAEVEALIAAYDRPDSVFDRNALHVAGNLLSALRIEPHIGPYRVLRELGRGGMGVVYLAERDDGQYRRRVAVKVLRHGPDPDELHRRFLAERQILASLNHPNIAQLLDGGVTDTHIPYLVMEYVDGVPITTYCDRQRLGVDERLHLFRDVCAAVHHAHQNLVIHRDIKPSNILITEDRRVKLLDFGIAKLLNPMLGPADQAFTRTEWRIMTPEYASPEQVRGDSLTTASDVYALGVLLYELLCGRRPHRITSGSPQELTEVIVRREPELPSVTVSHTTPAGPDGEAAEQTPEAIASDRHLSVDRLRARLKGDLDAIVMMALRKESARRYGSADLLWEDVQRHLDGLPVLAHRGTRWYRVQKFLGRHRLEAIAASAVAVSLVAGTSIAIRQAAVASRERDRAEQALGQSREVTDFLVRLFRTPAPAGSSREQVTARDMLATGTTRIEQLAGQPIVQAQMLDALGRVNDQLGRFADAERMLRRALELRRAHLGANHVDVAATLNNLSNVLAEMDRTDDALELSREALAIQRRVLGPKHPDVALALSTVARRTTDLAAAESLYRETRDIQRATLGPRDAAVATTDRDLAGILLGRGKYDEAEAMLRESLAIRERLTGPDHASVTVSMVFLADLLRVYRSKPAEAESLYNKALGILRQESPQRPSRLVGALSGLEYLSHARGDHVRAEGFARQILDAHRRALGAEHPIVTEGMEGIAEHLAAQRRYAEADSMLGDATAMLQRTVGSEHIRMSGMLTTRGRLRAAAGRLDEAEADLRQAVAIVERLEGPTSGYTAEPVALLADVLERRGNRAEANALFDRAATILRPLPPRAGYSMRAAYAAIADHYRALGRPDDETYFRRLIR
jgi:serine/threonine protein kinase